MHIEGDCPATGDGDNGLMVGVHHRQNIAEGRSPKEIARGTQRHKNRSIDGGGFLLYN